MASRIPEFRPSPAFPGGHMQTLAGYFFRGGVYPYRACRRLVDLDDGDQIVLHDDCPDSWQTGDGAALLIHGLAGCHTSAYMERIAAKLNKRGVRTFRMDMRGCGAGFLISRGPTHSGRTGDVVAALALIAELCPGSPVAGIGFSLGANLLLNLAAERIGIRPSNLDRAMAVCPPIDLAACSNHLRRGRLRF